MRADDALPRDLLDVREQRALRLRVQMRLGLLERQHRVDAVAALGRLLAAPGGVGAEDEQRGEAARAHAVARERERLRAGGVERDVDALGQVAQLACDRRDFDRAAVRCHDALQAGEVVLQVLEDLALGDDLLVDPRERLLHLVDLGRAESEILGQSSPERAGLAQVFFEVALGVDVVQRERLELRGADRAVLGRRRRPIGKRLPLLQKRRSTTCSPRSSLHFNVVRMPVKSLSASSVAMPVVPQSWSRSSLRDRSRSPCRRRPPGGSSRRRSPRASWGRRPHQRRVARRRLRAPCDQRRSQRRARRGSWSCRVVGPDQDRQVVEIHLDVSERAEVAHARRDDGDSAGWSVGGHAGRMLSDQPLSLRQYSPRRLANRSSARRPRLYRGHQAGTLRWISATPWLSWAATVKRSLTRATSPWSEMCTNTASYGA